MRIWISLSLSLPVWGFYTLTYVTLQWVTENIRYLEHLVIQGYITFELMYTVTGEYN